MKQKLGDFIDRCLDQLVDKNFELSFLIFFGVILPAFLLAGLVFIDNFLNVFSFADSTDNILLYFATTFAAGMSGLMTFVVLRKTLKSNKEDLQEQKKQLDDNYKREAIERYHYHNCEEIRKVLLLILEMKRLVEIIEFSAKVFLTREMAKVNGMEYDETLLARHKGYDEGDKAEFELGKLANQLYHYSSKFNEYDKGIELEQDIIKSREYIHDFMNNNRGFMQDSVISKEVFNWNDNSSEEVILFLEDIIIKIKVVEKSIKEKIKRNLI